MEPLAPVTWASPFRPCWALLQIQNPRMKLLSRSPKGVRLPKLLSDQLWPWLLFAPTKKIIVEDFHFFNKSLDFIFNTRKKLESLSLLRLFTVIWGLSEYTCKARQNLGIITVNCINTGVVRLNQFHPMEAACYSRWASHCFGPGSCCWPPHVLSQAKVGDSCLQAWPPSRVLGSPHRRSWVLRFAAPQCYPPLGQLTQKKHGASDGQFSQQTIRML